MDGLCGRTDEADLERKLEDLHDRVNGERIGRAIRRGLDTEIGRPKRRSRSLALEDKIVDGRWSCY